MARTQQWIVRQKLKFFRQILYDNNISLKDMYDILVWYFRQEARYDAAEKSASPPTGAHEPNDPTSPPGPSFEVAAPLVDVEEIEATAADAEKPPVDTQEGEELIALSCSGVLEEPLAESPPRALPTRDIEELLRDVAPCNRSRSAHMWLCALEGLAPEDVPYSVFGVTGFRYKASSTTTTLPSAVASSPPDEVSM